MRKSLNYHNYLELDKILDAQTLQSKKSSNLIHDEMLFIITHQSYELWFKQILHELDDVQHIFSVNELNDKAIYRVVTRIQRIIKILNLAIDQMKIIESMTPMDFLEFRDLLGTASGFQSVQFRIIEIKLGVKHKDIKSLISSLDIHQQDRIFNEFKNPSLLNLIETWLERIPFLETEDFSFWDIYKKAFEEMLQREKSKIDTFDFLTESERQGKLDRLRLTELHFIALLDDHLHENLIKSGEREMSRKAIAAALLIYLYRDQPIFQLPFMLLSSLVQIDELMASFRHAHILMTERMIGQRMGTGGSTGYQYLVSAMQSRKIYKDLTNLSSLLVKTSDLAMLPINFEQKLGFQYSS